MKKYFGLFYLITFFTVLLLLGFLCFPNYQVYAAEKGLEVSYPEISGKTITKDTGLPDYAEYLFNIGMFLGFFTAFISLVVAGVLYFLSPINASFKSNARDRISGAISGLLILIFTYLIITTINPSLNILKFDKPETVAENNEQQNKIEKDPGIYFYDKKDCLDTRAQPNTLSLKDLGALKNKINSVGVIQDSENEIFYVSILYANPDLWGKCQYLDPNEECQKVEPFASSASIYEFDPDPNGDGVYFYRNSCFNQGYTNINGLISYCNDNSGGYYKVSNDEIKNDEEDSLFIAKLDSLKFTNVPKEQKDCVEFKNNGYCTKEGLKAPSLGGENISSVIINGDYLVLFVYRGPKDNKGGPWLSCQEFPTINDINRMGPQQIKWQNIRNSGGIVPNYVIIIPIK